MDAKKTEKQDAVETLRGFIADGDTVYCILRKRAPSGMSRQIGVVVFKDGHYLHPNYLASKVTGYTLNKEATGVRVNGCGFDAGGALVDDIRHALGYKKLAHRWL